MKRLLLLLFVVLAVITQANAQFFEDFNSGIPNSWTVLNEAGGDVWEIDQQGWGGGSGLRLDLDANVDEDFLITPQFLVSIGSSERISFHVLARDADISFDVLLSTSGTSATDFSITIASETEPEAEFSNYSRYEYDLSAYDGQNVYVAIVPTTPDNIGFVLLELDEFSNDSFDCKSPYALSGSPLLLTEAILSWRHFPGQQDWSVQYGETDFPLGTGTIVEDDNEFAGLTITGLTSGVSYDYYVQSNCGTDDSQWVGPYTIVQPQLGEGVAFPIPIDLSTDSCSSESTITFDYDQGFPFYTFPGNENVYLNFSCDPQATVVKVGVWTRFTSPANGAIKITTDNPEDNFVIHTLNCNNQGICFRDDQVFCYRNPTNMFSQTVLNLDPNTEYSLAIWRSGSFPNTDISEICVEALGCVIPVDLDVNVISDTDAEISWTPYDGSQTTWEYVVQEEGLGEPMGSGISTMSTTATVSGTQNTTYEFYVRTDCGGGSFSDWAGPFEWLQSIVPANNNCEDAELLVEQTSGECTFLASGNTLGADYSPDNFDDCTFDDEDVWYTFVATSPRYRFRIIGTNGEFTETDYSGMLYDSDLDCTSEDDFDNLLCVYNDDDEAYIIYDLVVGNTYYFRVSMVRFSSDAGLDSSFDLCISIPPPPPANNNCVDAMPIQTGMSYNGDTTWATNFDDIPLCNNPTNDDYNVVWYSYTGLGSEEDITISFCERLFPVEMAVFTGSCNDLECFSSFTNSEFVAQAECSVGFNRNYTFNSDGTSTYYIAIRGNDDDDFGLYSFDVSGITLSTPQFESNAFTIFPNPAKSSVNINNLNNIPLDKIELVDINGRIVESIEPEAGFGSMEIALTKFSQGLYFVRLYSDNSIISKKLLVQ
ncbi:choice-of-anchor J domain-containing protein [Winogradskyella sp. 3972H.M.0a.05]|uniref:T9SS-dependent choice-of-anchor J family protein n=1 Tax=Winogradskyella sp. 3972H.M.0a.05 TaxID=2950277 RepID=UPI003392B643